MIVTSGHDPCFGRAHLIRAIIRHQASDSQQRSMTQSSGQSSLLVKLRSTTSVVIDSPNAEIRPVNRTAAGLASARYKIAHFPEYGVIVALVSPGFVRLRAAEQPKVMGKLQHAAKAAGFVGTVVPVWRSGDSFDFLGAPVFERHMKSLRWTEILARVEGAITCD